MTYQFKSYFLTSNVYLIEVKFYKVFPSSELKGSKVYWFGALRMFAVFDVDILKASMQLKLLI